MVCRSINPKRPAFTLVELLVVIAIIGILIALLLPAVQSAREAARRSQCSNNLKQIALAILSYDNANKTLPPGSIAMGTANETARTSWSIAILPFMEQQTLYNQYNQNRPNNHVDNRKVIQSFLPTQVCPTDIDTDKLQRPLNGSAAITSTDYAPGSYKAIAGGLPGSSSDGGAWWDNPDMALRAPNLGAGIPPDSWRGIIHTVNDPTRAGTVRSLKSEKLSDVRDGLSNTMMIAEYHTKTNPRRRTFWAISFNEYNMACAVAQTMTRIPDYDKCQQICTATPGCGAGGHGCKRGLAALHPGGMNAAMADGSVRFLQQGLNLNIYVAIATIQLGDVVPDSF
jgi:prepilin-type N-terminal cleavage/methylation domain-containing protein/prepilin-type processing-associated H-X9-DG protein